MSVTRNVPVQLTAVLGDGRTDQFLTAFITNSAGAEIAVIALPHIGRGKYEAVWTPTFLGYASATYIAYSDSGRLTPNPDYDLGEDKFFIVEQDVTIKPTVPAAIEVPAMAPDKMYVLGLTLQNSDGTPVAPNITPTVTIFNNLGSAIIAKTNMFLNSGLVGNYLYNFVVTPFMTAGSIRIQFETQIHGITSTTVVASMLTEDSSAGGLADDVWSHPDRTLTTYPDFATRTDVVQSADHTIASLTQHFCGFSTAMDTKTAVQKLVCWLVINSDIVISATHAVVTIDSPDTGNVWNGTIELPNVDGIFTTTMHAGGFYKPGINYLATIKINNGAITYTTVQPFVTVV